MESLRRQSCFSIYVCMALLLITFLGSSLSVAAAKEQKLQIFAASSLTEAFNEMERAFERANPGVDITSTFAATSVLRSQIEHGATPDIFASADLKHMQALTQKGIILGKYVPIAHNRIALIVPAVNPARIRSVADTAKPGVSLIGCSVEVPVGAYTIQVIDKLGASGKFGADYSKRVKANFRSMEPNVKGIVAKILTGDADAGFCYESDVTTSIRKQVKVIPIPIRYNVLASSYIGVVKGVSNPQLAKRFISAVLSPAGQAILKRHGMVPLKGK
jgi:molybdate transport system substrate-binding protein